MNIISNSTKMSPSTTSTTISSTTKLLPHYLVIGGAGFLGTAIVKQLLKSKCTISILDIHIPKTKLLSVTYHTGDITNQSHLLPLLTMETIVIHTASPPHGKQKHLYKLVNVKGTKNIIQACRIKGVKKLVFTSSASVIFNGQDILGGDEGVGYCRVHMDAYNESKAEAEQFVLEANDSKLATCCLRPSGIFGPGYLLSLHLLLLKLIHPSILSLKQL